MALEQVFGCPKTLSRLRSGPLGKFLDGFCNWLLDRGFRRQAVTELNKKIFRDYMLYEILYHIQHVVCKISKSVFRNSLTINFAGIEGKTWERHTDNTSTEHFNR